MVVFGNDLFVGGLFTEVRGVPETKGIARWDGVRWHSVGGGITRSDPPLVPDGFVATLAVADSNLFAGGRFTQMGNSGITVNVARWDGEDWHPLGSGLGDRFKGVSTLTVSGDTLYAGGNFEKAGSLPVGCIARWDGDRWHALGEGLKGSSSFCRVSSIAVKESIVYAAGSFRNVADTGGGRSHFAQWDGESWSLPGGIRLVWVDKVFVWNDELHVAGRSLSIGSVGSKIGRWDGEGWQPIEGLTGFPAALTVHEESLYVARFPEKRDYLTTPAIVRADSPIWQEIASFKESALHGVVTDLLAKGSDLYVAGTFLNGAGKEDADYLARWDGREWHAVAPGLSGAVQSIALIGDDLFVGGEFTEAGATPGANGIARWDGNSWSALGSGLDGKVEVITVVGSDIYVGGLFQNAGGVDGANNIARWDGNEWHALGDGLNSQVFTIASAGSDIIVGGSFGAAGGIAEGKRIARWNGLSWTALGNGFNRVVRSVAVLGDQIFAHTGVFIYRWEEDSWTRIVKEDFHDIGGVLTVHQGELLALSHRTIHRWDGEALKPVTSEVPVCEQVSALAVREGAIFAGGACPAGGRSNLAMSRHVLGSVPNADIVNFRFVPNNSSISSLNYSIGHIQMLYLNSANDLVYRRYSAADEQLRSAVILEPASSSQMKQVALAMDLETETLFAFWVSGRSGELAYKRGFPPYESDDWDDEPTVLVTSGVHELFSVAPHPSDSEVVLTWAQSDGVTRTIFSERIVLEGEIEVFGGSPLVPLQSGDLTPTSEDGTDFGEIDILSEVSERHTFVIQNVGSRDLQLLGEIPFEVTGEHASEFTVTAENNSNLIELNQTLTFGVTFQPTALGVRRASISIASNDPDENPYTFAVQGKATSVDSDGDGLTDFDELDLGTNPNLKDTDSDGVDDAQEISDSTDPLDKGSVRDQLRSPVHAVWNGFLGMTNILETINTGEERLEGTISLLSLDGTTESQLNFSLAPGAQQDFILNEFEGFAGDTFGTVRLDFNGSLEGRVFFYKPTDKSSSEYDFAFGVPFLDPLRGESAVGYNTFQPSANPVDVNFLVANWLTIVNLSATPQEYQVVKYSQVGEVLEERVVLVAPLGRVDLDGGHELPGPSRVGLIRVVPVESTAPYLSFLMRYGLGNDGGFEFAFPLLSRAGTGRTIHAPIATTLLAQNWVEVINTTDENVDATISFFSSQGELLKGETYRLGAFSQRHFNANEVLGESTTGYVSVQGDKKESLLTQSMFYFRGPAGDIDAMYGSQAREALPNPLIGSYNLFLDMDAELTIINPGAGEVRGEVAITRLGESGIATDILIAPGSTLQLDLHDKESFDLSRDTYGVVALPSMGEPLIAEMVRRRFSDKGGRIDFAAPTPVR